MKQPPGLEVMKMGVKGIQSAPDDPDDTMNVALTRQECATIAFGNVLISMMFHELLDITAGLSMKMMELASAQNFLPELPDYLKGMLFDNDNDSED